MNDEVVLTDQHVTANGLAACVLFRLPTPADDYCFIGYVNVEGGQQQCAWTAEGKADPEVWGRAYDLVLRRVTYQNILHDGSVGDCCDHVPVAAGTRSRKRRIAILRITVRPGQSPEAAVFHTYEEAVAAHKALTDAPQLALST